MEQPSDPHLGCLRRAPPSRNVGRRDLGMRGNVGARAQGRAERMLALFSKDIFREPVQTPCDSFEGFQRMGGASNRRFYVQRRDQRGAGAASESDQGC